MSSRSAGRHLGSSAVLWLATTGVACTAPHVWVAWPSEPDGLVGVVVDRDRGRAVAVEVGEALEVVDGAALELALYQETLEELGLSAGELELGAACRRCALISPLASFDLRDSADEDRVWVATVGLSTESRTILVADAETRCRSCPSFEIREVELPEAVRPAGGLIRVVPLSERQALLVPANSDRLFTVDVEGRVEAFCEAATWRFEAVGHRDGQGGVWVSPTRGDLGTRELWRFDTTNGGAPAACEALTSTRTVVEGQLGEVNWIDGGERASGVELVLKLAAGGLAWFEPGRPPRVQPLEAEPDNAPRVAWIGPAEALVVVGDGDLLHARETEVRRRSLNEIGLAGVTGHSVARTQSLGVLVGTRRDYLVRWTSDGLEPVGKRPMPFFDRIEAIHETLGGVMLALPDGGLGFMNGDGEYCPRIESGSRSDNVKSIAPLGPGQWVLGGNGLYLVRTPTESVLCP